MMTEQKRARIGSNLSGNSTGQDRFGHNKWQLLKAVEHIREHLELKGTSISVLRAMLSFMRRDTLGDAGEGSHVCFASNAALAKRAHVSIQTVERHVAKLIATGLITRQTSGNGKRWARRDRAGQVVLASGLSLMPLVERHGEFVQIAERLDARLQELNVLRDRCKLALAELAMMDDMSGALEALRARARNLLRRKPDHASLTQLLVDISEKMANRAGVDDRNMRGSDHDTEGHKDTILNPSVVEDDSGEERISQDRIERAYPKLCAQLRNEPSARGCDLQMENLAAQLGLGHVWTSIQVMGPAKSFMTLGYMLERIDKIRNPKAYAYHLMNKLESGQISLRDLLSTPLGDPRVV